MVNRKGAYRVLMWRTVDKRPLGRPWHTLRDNFKMNRQEVGRGGMDCSDVAKDRDRWWALVNVVMNFWVL
jgi:hypothetical protein